MIALHYLILLASSVRWRYAASVPKKEGNEVESSEIEKAHNPRNADFLRVYVITSFLWAAVAVRLRPAGSLFGQSFNTAICCPPRLKADGGLTKPKRSHHHD